MFKIILSPEFGERMDLDRLAHEFMTRTSRELGVALEWVAAVHRNTDYPHVHIALRGSGDLRLPRELVKHGLRRYAEDLCTAQLGYRTELDVRESERREVTAQHPTSLDRLIAELEPGDRPHPPLAARLRTLERMGLAKLDDAGNWEVHPAFLSILRSMKRATDRQKMLAAHAAAISNPHLPIQYTPTSEMTHLEGRVVGHAIDDATGVPHMILEGNDQRIHLIPQDNAIERARRDGQLAPNAEVRLRRLVSGSILVLSPQRTRGVPGKSR
jgi:hypothetical protein